MMTLLTKQHRFLARLFYQHTAIKDKNCEQWNDLFLLKKTNRLLLALVSKLLKSSLKPFVWCARTRAHPPIDRESKEKECERKVKTQSQMAIAWYTLRDVYDLKITYFTPVLAFKFRYGHTFANLLLIKKQQQIHIAIFFSCDKMKMIILLGF